MTPLDLALTGLINRYESLRRQPLGIDELPSQWDDRVNHVKYRILDLVASRYPNEDVMPNAVVITHKESIYRCDFVEGTFRKIGRVTIGSTPFSVDELVVA